MKIVIITNYWKNSPGGGIMTYITNLVTEFKNRKLEVDVIFKFGSDPQSHSVKGGKIVFSLKSYLILTKLKPNIIFSQGTWYCLFSGVMYKIFHNVMLVHTFHTYPSDKLPLFGKLFIKFLLNKCDCVTFVSKGLEKQIKYVYRAKLKNSVITYAGVDSREVSDDELKEFSYKLGLKNGSIILLAQGFTSDRLKCEGAKLLISATKKLLNKYPNISLILTGNGIYLDKLQTFSKKEGISEYVLFPGFVQNPYIPLKLCDIYTHISLGDGFPIALLEAMSLGKPILATPVGGIPEAISDGINGILIEPKVDSIVEKIDYLLQNNDIAVRLGNEAKITAQEKFTWDKTADSFLSLYNISQNYC